MITDKQIIETFKNIKEYCRLKKDCETCRFYRAKNECSGYCQLEEIGWTISITPKYWNIKAIERLIND